MKVLIIPDTITARDGDRHFIDVSQLKQLYGVRIDDEVVRYPGPFDPRFRDEETMARHFPEHVVLRPRSDGEYYDIHEITSSRE